jgi:hypothetical protein
MAWTTPGTAVAGEVLTAAFWNEQVRDNLANLRALANIQVATVTTPVTLSSVSTDVFYDATGLSVTITPTSASSKIRIMVDLSVSLAGGADARAYFRVLRDSTPVGVGTSTGNRAAANKNFYEGIATIENSLCWNLIDTPGTTSATTYKVQYAKGSTSLTVYLNRTGGDSDLIGQARSSSTIMVQEIPV